MLALVQRATAHQSRSIDSAARRLLGIDEGALLDLDAARALISARRIEIVSHRSAGRETYEIREGDVVRWRGWWTWADGCGEWREEWLALDRVQPTE